MATLPSWLSSPNKSNFFGRFQVAVSRDVTPCPLVRYLTIFRPNLLPPSSWYFILNTDVAFFRTVNKSVTHYTASRLKHITFCFTAALVFCHLSFLLLSFLYNILRLCFTNLHKARLMWVRHLSVHPSVIYYHLLNNLLG